MLRTGYSVRKIICLIKSTDNQIKIIRVFSYDIRNPLRSLLMNTAYHRIVKFHDQQKHFVFFSYDIRNPLRFLLTNAADAFASYHRTACCSHSQFASLLAHERSDAFASYHRTACCSMINKTLYITFAIRFALAHERSDAIASYHRTASYSMINKNTFVFLLAAFKL